jgi:hypothetical protein
MASGVDDAEEEVLGVVEADEDDKTGNDEVAAGGSGNRMGYPTNVGTIAATEGIVVIISMNDISDAIEEST